VGAAAQSRCLSGAQKAARDRRLNKVTLSIRVHEIRAHASWNSPEFALARRCLCTNVLHFDLGLLRQKTPARSSPKRRWSGEGRCLSARLRSAMLDAQTGLRLRRSSGSNAATNEGFSVRICDRNNDVYMAACSISIRALQCLRNDAGNIIKSSCKRMTYILISMSHAGNRIPPKVPGGDKEKY
jgi:hypothetical protein